jgi:hypothetical protein
MQRVYRLDMNLQEIENKLSRIQILRVEADQDDKEAELIDTYGNKAIIIRRGLE